MLEIENIEKGKSKRTKYSTIILASLLGYWNNLSFVYSFQCSVSTCIHMFINGIKR